MKSGLNKSDVIWTYISKAFSLLSGILTLPFVLKWLTEDEIAINFLLINILSYTIIFDLGFSLQFSRQIGFAFGGAQSLKSVGYEKNINKKEINYALVKNVIKSAEYIYMRLSIILLTVLLTFGTWYIVEMTKSYTLNDSIIILWIIFSILETIDFYFKFYTPLLQGKGAVAEQNRIDFLANIIRVVVTILLLYLGLRLWAVVIGFFSKIIITRFLSVYVLYYQDGLLYKIRDIVIYKNEIKSLIHKLWYNAKRTAIVQIASFCNMQLGFLFAGLYLTSSEVSSFGLLIQLVGVIYGTALSLSNSVSPIYSHLRANNDIAGLKRNFYFSTGMFYYIYILGALVLILAGPLLLHIIESKAVLPPILITLIYLLYKFLEGQHCLCIYCLSSKNKIYDTESASIMAIATVAGLYMGIRYLHLELLGIILIQAIIALAYANWKWPYELCKEFKITYVTMVSKSFSEVLNRAFSLKTL